MESLYFVTSNAGKIKEAEAILGIGALHAGYIEKRGDEKRVIIEPAGLDYGEETMNIR